MGKLSYILTFIIVVDLLLHFSGLLATAGTPTSYALSNLGLTQPENIGTSSFWTTIGILGTLSVAGVVAGIKFGTDYQTIIYFGVGALLIPFFLGMIGDFWIVTGLAADVSPALGMVTTIIFGTMIFSAAFTILEWARLKD